MKTKILSTAFALVTSFGAIGAAAAQPGDGNSFDRRHDGAPAQTGDGNTFDRRHDEPAPVVVEHRPMPIKPGLRRELLGSVQAWRKRGSVTFSVEGAARFDKLALVSSDSNLDIMSVDLVYRRGRIEHINPSRDGMLTIDATKGLKSIQVKYASHGRIDRDASLKLFGVK